MKVQPNLLYILESTSRLPIDFYLNLKWTYSQDLLHEPSLVCYKSCHTLLPTPLAYEMFSIYAFLSSLLGAWLTESLKCCPNGVATSFDSCMLNMWITLSRYDLCVRTRTFFLLFLIIYIPNILLALPKYFISNSLIYILDILLALPIVSDCVLSHHYKKNRIQSHSKDNDFS